ncbi:MAG: methyltransferase domain-containing protein [Myxococcota bacterium]
MQSENLMDKAQFELNAKLETSHWWFMGRRQILRALIEALVPPNAQHKIVDIGCGTGANIALLQDAYTCVGIDPSERAIELARERFPHTSFLCASQPEDLEPSYRDAKLYMLCDVLEHVPDDFVLLSTWLSYAQPGSYFLLTVPAEPALWSKHDQAHGHFRRYTLPRFEHLWTGLPVQTKLLTFFNARLYPLIAMIRRLNQWLYRSGREVSSDVTMPHHWINKVLTSLFAGEQQRLLHTLKGASGYSKGLSLIALLERRAQPMQTRTKPDYLAPDTFIPYSYR